MTRYGFTMLELLLAVSLIGIVTAITVPISYSFVRKNNLTVAESTAVHAFRRASALSAASQNDATWGIYIQEGSVTLFRGASFAARNQDYDEITNIYSGIEPSGLTEVVFDQFTGYPSATGTLTLTTGNNLTETVVVNAYGMLTY